jgi:hypothetical protein
MDYVPCSWVAINMSHFPFQSSNIFPHQNYVRINHVFLIRTTCPTHRNLLHFTAITVLAYSRYVISSMLHFVPLRSKYVLPSILETTFHAHAKLVLINCLVYCKAEETITVSELHTIIHSRYMNMRDNMTINTAQDLILYSLTISELHTHEANSDFRRGCYSEL